MQNTTIAAIAAFLMFGCVSFTPTSCDQQAALERKYEVITPKPTDDTAERLNALESAARAAEIEALKQYEQMDYQFFRGDAEAYK
ncbi:hypothetical protein PL75_03405 [Neisseria arctica]|uniref:Uncharacterized protein n=1 Tax=Neisseria arctica TaxID=1470200 RepID=A0A0J0YT62_9NEIS|nr:hypothetical protein [Neisseria arctica]KLT73281.1 hypothetical protein PL75_03405 [Neisseria arctica]UOO87460.1 hypothetical protein LVJ86_04245 [Neisseria arctica]